MNLKLKGLGKCSVSFSTFFYLFYPVRSAAKLTVRAMPDPSVSNSVAAAETSFNTDR